MTNKQIIEELTALVKNWHMEIENDEEFNGKYGTDSEFMYGYNNGVDDCAKDLEKLINRLSK